MILLFENISTPSYGWERYSLLHIFCTLTYAAVQKVASFAARIFNPLPQRLSLSKRCNVLVASSVSRLFLCGSEAAIIRLIMSVIVGALDPKWIFVSISKSPLNENKTIVPLSTYSDASLSISMELGVFGVVTAGHHRLPYSGESTMLGIWHKPMLSLA